MLKTYIKIAWRNILKSRFYSAINIIGLSTGIAFTFLIGGYLWGQLQTNTELKNADRQYILATNWKHNGGAAALTSSGALAKALKEHYPDLVANYYRWDGVTSNVSKDNRVFRENISICDSTMLQMYGFELLHGNPEAALSDPFSVVLTEAMALKYFGKTDIVGEYISIENFSGSKHDFAVSGVLNSYPANSVTDLLEGSPNKIFVPISNLDFFGRNMNWQNPHIVNYVELQKAVTPTQLEKPIKRLLRENAGEVFNFEGMPAPVLLKEYYVNSNNGLVKKMLYALSAIAIFILAMAIINFVNMSVSRAATRMREIGIRKVLGGLRKQIMFQFLVESVILVFIAAILAFLIFVLARDSFGNIVGKEIPSPTDFPLYFVFFPLLLILLIGFVAGVYPAFILSSLKSVTALKGTLSSIKENVWLRKSLVAFQFGTATIAFVGAIVITKQVNLFLDSDLGYDKDYIVSAQLPRDWTRAGVQKMTRIRDEFSRLAAVKDVSLSFEIPNGNNSNDVPLYKFGFDSASAVRSQVLENDEKFLPVYQIPLIAGSAFEGGSRDSLQVILNETAVRQLAWENAGDAIGKQVRIPGNPNIYTVKGVTSDFHFGTMQKKMGPIVMFHVQYDFIYRYFSFKIKPGNITQTLDVLQKKWAALMPGAPFEYSFMDETIARMYRSETQLKKASYTATFLALIIVLLGVTGLVSLSVHKRTKEIGIRKVLGSPVRAIIGMFIQDFLPVVLVAGIVAWPLSYVIMDKWLQGYAYRVSITAVPFLISIICLGLVTTLLICVQTIKAAVANPVGSLRNG